MHRGHDVTTNEESRARAWADARRRWLPVAVFVFIAPYPSGGCGRVCGGELEEICGASCPTLDQTLQENQDAGEFDWIAGRCGDVVVTGYYSFASEDLRFFDPRTGDMVGAMASVTDMRPRGVCSTRTWGDVPESCTLDDIECFLVGPEDRACE